MCILTRSQQYKNVCALGMEEERKGFGGSWGSKTGTFLSPPCGAELGEPAGGRGTREMGGVPRARLGRTRLLLKTLKWLWMHHPKRPRQRRAMTRLTTWLKTDKHVLKIKIVGGGSRFGHEKGLYPMNSWAYYL